MTETKTVEKNQAETEGETRELKAILDQLSDMTVTEDIKTANGTFKLDMNRKIGGIERLCHSPDCKKLDHAEYYGEDIWLSDIIMIYRGENRYNIYCQNGDRHCQRWTFWPNTDERSLVNDEHTIRISLNWIEAQKLIQWLNHKMEA